MHYYEVAPLKIVRLENATFTYASSQELAIGTFVTISIGKQLVTGIIVRRTTKPHYATKTIDSLIEIPCLPKPLVATALWMSDYYATHLATVMQTVLPRGFTKKRRTRHTASPDIARERTNFLFTKSQQKALQALEAMTPGSSILHGITGSGKTAVYIEAIRRAMKDGKSSIVLIPEIALTSQLVAEISQHFDHIVLTHSRQTEAERHLSWLTVATATTPLVAVGPRSALFLPFKNLGLIVIDEAHEPSYKQEQSPRYSALRVASILASQHKAKVIQGSATPLVSEYYLAKHAGRPIIEMKEKARAQTIAPCIELVDMTKRNNFTRHRLFSHQLLTQLEQNIDAGTQSLIFHNRRGSASTTLCESCGWSALCHTCFVPYTLHADRHRLECHICGRHERVPTSCPVCYSTDIIHKGIGTKLIESELRKLFPEAIIARFDGDVTAESSLAQRYQELYDGRIDIIIGTQVIAKGLDLPHLRTVGIVQADAGLALPDFMAAERTFQLLAQVVGRVGRNTHETSVIVQSYQPTAPAVQLGLRQNYDEFYAQTILTRQQAHFPPFTYLLKLTCIYKTEAAAIRNATKLAAVLKQQFPEVHIFGPTPAFYERQHDTYRWQLIIKSPKRSQLLALLKIVPTTHWQADIDPASLL